MKGRADIYVAFFQAALSQLTKDGVCAFICADRWMLNQYGEAGLSIGNNLNNRAEEVVGLASDVWVAFREGRFGDSRAPFLGYFFLLQDFSGVRRPVRCKEPYFPIDPVFNGLSYADRYAVLCQRLMLERLYNAVCLTLATKPDESQPQTVISHPTPDVSFKRFVATLEGHVYTFINSAP
jgi:hypothetical protein